MKCISFLAAALCCGNANAYQIIIGNVAMLQPTYLPAVVTFQMTTGSSVCPAGAWLQWTNPDQSNNKAVYATLPSALTADKTVRLYIDDGDTTCTGRFLHLID